MTRAHSTPAPVSTTGLRFITATVGERPVITDRVISGPAALGPSREGPSFDQSVMVGDREVAVCYLDHGEDWTIGKAHWAVGPVPEIVRWLMDEAAVSERRRGLIVAIGLRELWRICGFATETLVPLEHSVVDAIDVRKVG